MSDSGYQGSVVRTGVQRLNLLSRYGDALMRAYGGDAIDDGDFTDSALRQLLGARVLWRDDEDGHLRISHKLRELIAEMIADEQRRQTHADVAESLESLRNLVNRFLETQHKGNYGELEHLQRLLRAEIDDFNSRLADAIDSLWQKLNSDFGFVQSLDDKIRENDRAQKQAKRLLDGLQLIDFSEWIDLAGSHGFLRRLLVSQWQNQVSHHYSSLRLVQDRLVQLITRFREQQASARLVRGMAQFLRTQTGYQPPEYAKRSEVPPLLNMAKPLHAPAYPETERDSHQALMVALFARVPKRREQTVLPESADAVDTLEIEAVAPLQRAVKQAAEAFFLKAVDEAGQPLSAMDYWHEQSCQWPADIWLFQVLAEYDGLPAKQRAQFRLTATEEPQSRFNELTLVRDYDVALAPLNVT